MRKQIQILTISDEEEPCELGSISSKNVQQQQLEQPRIVWQSPTNIQQKSSDSVSPPVQQSIAIKVEKSQEPVDTTHLSIPKVAASSSSETLTGNRNIATYTS